MNEYQCLYANRLLKGQTLSDDAESLMLAKLKMEMGGSQVNSLLKMKDDINDSKNLTKEYKSSSFASKINSSIDINFKILTSGCWVL